MRNLLYFFYNLIFKNANSCLGVHLSKTINVCSMTKVCFQFSILCTFSILMVFYKIYFFKNGFFIKIDATKSKSINSRGVKIFEKLKMSFIYQRNSDNHALSENFLLLPTRNIACKEKAKLLSIKAALFSSAIFMKIERKIFLSNGMFF